MAIYVWRDVVTEKGIYWGKEEGLISYSSDGKTWYTISDTNLGGHGDWLSDASIGHLFQWGNNHGFSYDDFGADGYLEKRSTTRVDASSYGPGNYYDSDTFIYDSTSANLDWSTSRNDNLWGDTTNTNEARRGPCPKGFHIPTRNETQTWINVFTSLYGEAPDKYALHSMWRVGGGGYIGYNNGAYGQLYNSDFWTSSSDTYSGYVASNVYDDEHPGSSTYVNRRGTGYSIRPFKNIPVQPSSTWVKLSIPKVPAGVYHNPQLGLITVSSGYGLMTISDKNLGATKAYNKGDTLNQDNCGYYYQWGNNHGFTSNVTKKSSTRVDATGYGPGNYYDSDTFITTSNNLSWSTVYNKDLWGGITGTYEAMRGPCPEGYHVPSINDTYYLRSLIYAVTGEWSQDIYTGAIKMPLSGYLGYSSGSLYSLSTSGYFWTSSTPWKFRGPTYEAGVNSKDTHSQTTSGWNVTGTGYPIRPFKNTPVVPDDTWIKLYPTSIKYDFTTTNNLTFYARQNSTVGYGWTSGKGYYSYIGNTGNYRTNVLYKFPDAMYVEGTLQKIKIGLNPHSNYSGGGIGTSPTSTYAQLNYGIYLGAANSDTTNRITVCNNNSQGSYYAYTYSAGNQIFVIDFDSKTAYVEGNSSTPVNPADYVFTQLQTAWNNKALYLDVIANQPKSSGYYSYATSIEIQLK